MVNKETLEKIANNITGEFESILDGTNKNYLEPNQRDVDMQLVYDYVLKELDINLEDEN